MQNGNLPSNHSSDVPAEPPSNGSPEPSPSSARDASLDLSSLLETVRREKVLILTTCLLVIAAVVGYTYTLPPVYQASALVKVDPESQGTSNIPGTIMSEATFGQTRNLAGEIGVLRNSIDLARRVTEKLRTAERADGNTSTFPVLQGGGSAGDTTGHAIARAILDKATFTPRGDRNMIEVTVESKSPEEASTIANLYAKAYKRFSREKARASVKAARDFLQTQAQKQEEKIDQLDEQWKVFARNTGLVERGEGGEQLAARFNELKARRDQVAFDLEKQQTQLELLRQQLRQFRPQLQESVERKQEASGLQSEITALEEKIAQMRAEAAKYYATNPDLEGDTTRIKQEFPDLASLLQRTEALEGQKRELTRRLVAKAGGVESSAVGNGTPLQRVAELRSQITQKELTISQLESQISALDAQIADYEARLNTVPSQRIQRKQLERKLKQAKTFHETILNELQRIAIAEESELGYVEVVRSAFVPGAPVRPNMRQNALLAVLLGLGLGIGLAFLKEAMNTRLRHPEDIEERGYTLLGVVPSMDPEIAQTFDGQDFIDVEDRQVSTRLMPLLNPWSSVTENYRLIQTNLDNGQDVDSETLLVTSALQQEGKTVTSVNLALTAALSGKRVLLIDADMRKPNAHKALDMPREPGLAEALESASRSESEQRAFVRRPTAGRDPIRGDSYIHRTPVEGLYFIPAGVPESAPSKLLDSGRIGRLLEATQGHFDVVVIDTPPTQAASDSVVIGAQTRATTLVVSADEADSRALDSAMSSLRAAGADVAGVVLNRYDEDKAASGNGYGYSYYRSEDYYEYQEDATGRPEPA